MNDMEKMVWAAAFAQAWDREYRFIKTHQVPHLTVDGISGFSCAELADLAVEKYREAMTGDDHQYLLPVKEDWESKAEGADA